MPLYEVKKKKSWNVNDSLLHPQFWMPLHEVKSWNMNDSLLHPQFRCLCTKWKRTAFLQHTIPPPKLLSRSLTEVYYEDNWVSNLFHSVQGEEEKLPWAFLGFFHPTLCHWYYEQQKLLWQPKNTKLYVYCWRCTLYTTVHKVPGTKNRNWYSQKPL